MPVLKNGPELPEGRFLTYGDFDLTGTGPIRGGAEEQYLDAVHRLLSSGSGTYPGPTMTFRARGMTTNSAGSSPMTSPSTVNSSPGWEVTQTSLDRAKNTPSLSKESKRASAAGARARNSLIPTSSM